MIEGKRVIDQNYRVSQVAFLMNATAGPGYKNFRHRLEDLSSLSLTYSESLQMLNYASGGFYRTHGDFLANLPVCLQRSLPVG